MKKIFLLLLLLGAGFAIYQVIKGRRGGYEYDLDTGEPTTGGGGTTPTL
jgi:hypothetical protein